jgi:hypothetical protein
MGTFASAERDADSAGSAQAENCTSLNLITQRNTSADYADYADYADWITQRIKFVLADASSRRVCGIGWQTNDQQPKTIYEGAVAVKHTRTHASESKH